MKIWVQLRLSVNILVRQDPFMVDPALRKVQHDPPETLDQPVQDQAEYDQPEGELDRGLRPLLFSLILGFSQQHHTDPLLPRVNPSW
jgi:hypothetical protein